MNILRKKMLQAKFNKARERASVLEDALDELALTGGRKSISFDSGEGKQATTYNDPNVMQKWLEMQYSIMESCLRKLEAGGGVVNMNMRRTNYIQPNWYRSTDGEWYIV